MQYSDYRSPHPTLFGFGLTPAVQILLIGNISVFIFQLLPLGLNSSFIMLFGLVPFSVHAKLALWQLVTYMFLHGDFWHIFFNMFALWMFGSEIERYWGTSKFLRFYFICGTAAGISSVLFSWNSLIPTIGASGAIYGILIAYAVLFPDRYIYIYMVFPIKAKYLIAGYMLLEFIATIEHSSSGIAHIAHLGGGLMGFLLLKSSGWFWAVKTQYIERKNKQRFRAIYHTQDEMAKLRGRIDLILDKINQVGYDRLTEEEKKILIEGSKLLSAKEEKN